MICLDQKINQLIVKWAGNPNGRWSDVEKDLLEYTERIRQEEREKVLQTKEAKTKQAA